MWCVAGVLRGRIKYTPFLPLSYRTLVFPWNRVHRRRRGEVGRRRRRVRGCHHRHRYGRGYLFFRSDRVGYNAALDLIIFYTAVCSVLRQCVVSQDKIYSIPTPLTVRSSSPGTCTGGGVAKSGGGGEGLAAVTTVSGTGVSTATASCFFVGGGSTKCSDLFC